MMMTTDDDERQLHSGARIDRGSVPALVLGRSLRDPREGTHQARRQVVYLELAPVDPRSLIQGDYMALRFALARECKLEATPPAARCAKARSPVCTGRAR